MGLDNPSRHVESQSQTFDIAGVTTRPVEPLEEMPLAILVDTDSLVAHAEYHASVLTLGLNGHVPSIGRVFHSVAQKVVQYLFQSVMIPFTGEGPAPEVEKESVTRGND